MPDTELTSYAVSPGAGIIRPAEQCPSPNQDARPDGNDPELIVIHSISLPPGNFGGRHIHELFTNCLDRGKHPYFEEISGLEVSAHLLVRRDGGVVQFVPFGRRAWHAGPSCWRGRTRCNDFSIGIEVEGDESTPYTDRQYTALGGIIRALRNAYPGLDARTIAGHCDISPGRKTDPGPAFDWLRLYDALADSDPDQAA